MKISQTLVIVGGVAGGASAATRARRMDEHARIILLEKDEYVSFANCGLPYFIGGEIRDRKKLLVATPELFANRFRIEVRTRHEVTQLDRQAKVVRGVNRVTGEPFEFAYDKLVLAPGASPIQPKLSGADAPNVFTLRNLEDTDRIKAYVEEKSPKKAVVVGAGFIGLEMVEQLHRLGMETSLVELGAQVLPPLDPEMAHLVQAALERHQVKLHLNDGIKGLVTADGSVTAVELASGTKVPAELVILGMGVRPNTRLAEQAGLELGPTGGIRVNAFMQTSDPSIYAAGDVVEYPHLQLEQPLRMPLAGPANRAGRLAGEHAVTGAGAPLAPVLGTAIVRAFDATAGTVGLSEKLLRKLERPFAAVFIEANHHAGYYPGAQALVLKLIYDPRNGKVLGAQAVGGEGVDKRIDILSTAIRFGGTVEDLTGLDLAYAPPFGSAKDPVHMAGFAAANARAGTVRFLSPGSDLSGYQVVDVRTLAEWTQGHLEGAIHMPVEQLRDRLAELDSQKPTAVVCRSGLRGYVAARLLQGHGFVSVSNVTGGMLMHEHATRSAAQAVPRAS